MSNGQARCKQPKDKEGLGTCLVLHIVLDWIWDEVLDLEEDLQAAQLCQTQTNKVVALSIGP